MAGLLDTNVYCDTQQALDVLVKFADWVKFRVDHISEEQQQGALDTEFGGMNEVLTNLYAVTGDPEHWRLARKFDHKAVFDPLARGEDRLSGLHANTPVRLALKIRHPAWAQTGMTVTINGKNEPMQTKAGSYASVEREWKDGDSIQVRLPMSLRLEAMPDDPKMIAFLYGPIVLAGDLGNRGLDSAKRYGPTAPQVGLIKPVDVPAFVGELNNVLRSTKPVAGKPLTFRTSGMAKPRDVTLVAFYKTFEPRYSVYWKVYSQAEWENRKTELAATESRRQQIERATVDAVQAGEEGSERDHGFQGENSTTGFFEGRKSRAAQEGWFSYTLKVIPDKPVTLVCTYRGSEGRRRVFDILVDGQRVATQSLEIHPTELFDVEYPLAEALTRGKERVSVKFVAHPEAIAGSVLDVRTVQLGSEKR
jgi:uncharacterized protein